jgi:hypothetical protein
MILQVWHGIPEGTLVGLAILSTLSGNLLLVGSLANLIVAERAALAGVLLSIFRSRQSGRTDHAHVTAVRRTVAVGCWSHAALAEAS